SLIPTLLVRGVPEALRATRAPLVYVPSLMTKRGETDGYRVSHCLEQVIRYAGRVPDAIVVHEGRLPDEQTQRYMMEQSQPIELDGPRVQGLGVRCIQLADLIAREVQVRHDPERTATALAAVFDRLGPD